MMLFQSSTEDEIIPELLKPLPEKVKRDETTDIPTEIPYVGIEKMGNIPKDIPEKVKPSRVDETHLYILLLCSKYHFVFRRLCINHS